MGETTALLYADRNELEEWKTGDTGRETLHSKLFLRWMAISWSETSQLVWVCSYCHCQVFVCSGRVSGVGFSRSWSFARHVWQRDIERARKVRVYLRAWSWRWIMDPRSDKGTLVDMTHCKGCKKTIGRISWFITTAEKSG